MAFPVREYYSFEDAVTYFSAKKETCSISDLIHFAETGAIEVCCFFRGCWSFDYHSEDDCRSCFIDIHKQQLNKHLSISQRNYIESHYTSNLCSYHIIADDTRQPDAPLMVMLRGFLTPFPLNPVAFWQGLLKAGCVDIGTIEFTVPSADIETHEDFRHFDNSGPRQSFSFKGSHLHLTDFMILKDEMDRIMNGGRDKKENIGEFNIVTPYSKPKTVNSQNSLILSLLKAYCPDAIERPHAALGKAGGLTKAFAKAGIDFPVTPETLAKWIKSST